jgi:hypothetical protein
VPFNVTLLNLTDDKLVGLKPVTVLDTFIGATKNFHESGLFSVSIFGKVGDERRSRRFSYIDVKISIFHPTIYRALTKLKKMYGEIIAGKTYATWSEEEKDFIKSDPLKGQTGFQFFRDHWKDIVFKTTDSDRRDQTIALIDKYKDKTMLSKLVVLPAGLRDFEIEADGRQSENEINNLYRKLLSLSNNISKDAVVSNPEILNTISYSIQSAYNQIYDLLENSIQGKKKLLMGKWASRRIFNGTRNVITAVNINSKDLGSKGNIDVNDTIIGLYQFLKATMPVSRFNLRNGFLSKVFTGTNAPAFLVNKKTFKKEVVDVSPRMIDAWMSDEGLEKVMTSFKDISVRHKAIEIEGKYLGLIYKGPDNTYKLMQDIDELPPTRSKNDVFPLTFCELLYLSVYKTSNNYPLFFTRYPITGIGSIYPSMVFLKPTVLIEERAELDENWQPMDDSHTAHQFPIVGSEFIDSLSPASPHLSRLGADFDGDTGSGNAVYSDEAITEVKNFLNSKRYYIGTDGKITYSSNTDTVAYVLRNMTGDPVATT